MKVFTRPLLIIMIALSLGLVLYLGWQATRVKQVAKRLLASKGISVEDIDIGFGSIRLGRINARPEGFSGVLEIEGAELDYNLLKLLRGGVDRGIEDLSLSNPKLIFDMTKATTRLGSVKGLSRTIPAGQLTLTGGQILLKGALDEAAVAHDVKGLIDARVPERIIVRLQGRFLSRDINAEVKGFVNTAEGTYELKLKAHSIELSDPDLGQLLGDTRLESGRMDLLLHLKEGRGASGDVTIRDLKSTSLDPEVRLVSLRGEIKDGAVFVHEGEGFWRGRNFSVRGRIPLELPLTLSLTAEFPDFELAELAGTIAPDKENLPSGSGTLSVTVQGPLDDLKLRGVFNSNKILVNGETIEDLKVRFTKAGSVFIVEQISGKIGEGVLRGNGRIAKTAKGTQVEMNLKANRFDLQNLSGVVGDGVSGTGDLTVRIDGNVQDPKWQVWYSIPRLTVGGRDIGTQKGWLKRDERWLRIRSSWENGALSGTLALLVEDSDLRINNFLATILQPDQRMNGKINIHGTPKSLETSGKLFVGDHNRLDVTGEIRSTETGERIDLRFRSEGFKAGDALLEIEAEFSADKDEVGLSPEIAKVKKGEKVIDAKLIFTNPFIARVLDIIKGVGETRELNGVIQVGGTVAKPDISGELTMEGTGEIDSLDVKFNFHWDDGHAVGDLQLQHGADVLLSLKGHRGPDGTDVRAEAKGIALSSFLSPFLPAGQTVKGKLSYNLSFIGRGSSRDLTADFIVEKGSVLDFPFDEMRGTLRGDFAAEDSRYVLEIADLKFWKEGLYRGSAKGTVPLSPQRELDVNVEIGGDILSLLSSFTSGIEGTSGEGSASLHLAGWWGAPVVEEARISFTGGQATFNLLNREIEDLKGRITLREGSRFLRIEGISGKIGGGRFVVENREETRVGGEELEPIILSDLGLSLGILVIRTDKKGIELNLPGLLRPGTSGRFELLGPPEQAGLYISGPNRSPLVKGICRVSGIEFTYPLRSSKSKGSSQEKDRFADLLRSIRWDLDVIAKGDVWYFQEREFGVADLASVDVRIKEGSELSFQGSVAEGTFHVKGILESREGTLSYLDTEFQIEEMGCELDTKADKRPLLWGRAKTTVYSDTTNADTDVFLKIYAVDEEADVRVDKGRLGEVRFDLTSSDPNDDTFEKVLARLGYSLDVYNRRAAGILTTGIQNLLNRTLVRPLERRIRRNLGLDVFRLDPTIVRNIVANKLPGGNDNLSYLMLLEGTRLTVGEYLLDKWFLFYRGELSMKENLYQQEELGLTHHLGLELRLRNRTSIEFEYEYDEIIRQGDKRFKIRHTVTF